MTAEPVAPSRRREWRVAGVVFFCVVALLLLYATVMIIRPFFSAIILAAVLVTLTFPWYRRIRAKMKGRSTAAAIVMLVLITIIIVLPAVILSLLLIQQANNLVEHLQSGQAQQILRRIDIPAYVAWIKRFVPAFDPQSVSPERLFLPVIRQIPGWVARNGAAVVGSVAGAIIGFALILLAAFFFFVEGEAILNELKTLSPLPDTYDQEFATKFKDVVDATFRGQVMTSIAQGIATGAGLMIAQVPGGLFWGAVAAILSLLPMVGAAVVWVPATVYLYIDATMGHRGYGGAIFLTVWGVIVVSTIDNVVRPWAMKGKAQLPAIPLLFAVLGGLQAFGFIGLVIGPLVFSMLMTVIDIYKRSFRTRAGETSPG
jgi:predicted PurR-regulated permease PerM